MALDFLTGCFGWRPTKLSRCNERLTRGWIWLLKLILFIPCAIAGFAARENYERVRAHPELSRWPYNEHVELGILLVYIATLSIFTWCAISSALLVRFQGPWILAYGLVDFGLAITLAVGVTMMGRFLPSSFNDCKSNDLVNNWQVAEGQKSFFRLLAGFLYPDPVTDDVFQGHVQAVCKELVSDWTLSYCVLFFQMLVSYIGIFFDEREYSLLNPTRPIIWLIILLIGPPVMIHAFLFPRIRLWFSYLVKSARRWRRTGTKPINIEPVKPFIPRYEISQIQNKKLQQVLTIEHVLLNVVDYMHYEDIVNFSLCCKAVREAIFPIRDLEHRVPKLKERCCEPETKTWCLYCNKRVCYDCKSLNAPFLPGLPGRRHVTFCRPYCRNCYYFHHARHPRGYKKPCKCHTTDRSLEYQDVCRSCQARSQLPNGLTEMQLTRHKRYQLQLRDSANAEGVTCGGCKTTLGKGIRWWVCGRCKGECRDRIHPPYVGKREVDVEKVEGAAEKVEERTRWKFPAFR